MTVRGGSTVRWMFLWGFPLGSFAATLSFWPLAEGTGPAFPVYLLSVGALFALMTIRMATQVLGLWSWRMPMAHLAFLWSTYSALGVLVISDTVISPLTAWAITKCASYSALIGGAMGTIIDIVGMDEELLELHWPPADSEMVKTVLSYSFRFFGVYGAIYGVAAMMAVSALTQPDSTQWLLPLIAGGAAAVSLPFVTYFLLTTDGRGRVRA